jgi:hypothetical protein
LVEPDNARVERDGLQLENGGPIFLVHCARIGARVGARAIQRHGYLSGPGLISSLHCLYGIPMQVGDCLPVRKAQHIVDIVPTLLLLIFTLQKEQLDVREQVHKRLPLLAPHRLQRRERAVLGTEVHVTGQE